MSPLPSPLPPRLDDQLCFALYAAARTVEQAYGPFLTTLGLTYPQFLVMMVLWESDDLTVGALGERLWLDSGTLTPLLKRLERAGQVVRQRDPQDERCVRIRLTDTGRALGQQAATHHEALVCAIPWEQAARLTALRDALHTLTATLRGQTPL